VRQENLYPLAPRAPLERPDDTGPVSSLIVSHELAADRPFTRSDLSRYGRSVLGSAEVVFLPIESVLGQKLERRYSLVGKPANELSIVESGCDVVWPGPVSEDPVGRILDALLLLEPVAATKVHAAAAHDGDSADVKMLLDQQHRGASVARRNGRREAGCSCSEDDDVDFAVPGNLVGLGGWRSGRAKSYKSRRPADAGDRTRPEELPSTATTWVPAVLLSTISIFVGHSGASALCTGSSRSSSRRRRWSRVSTRGWTRVVR
jgi:hypothetical protein